MVKAKQMRGGASLWDGWSARLGGYRPTLACETGLTNGSYQLPETVFMTGAQTVIILAV